MDLSYNAVDRSDAVCATFLKSEKTLVQSTADIHDVVSEVMPARYGLTDMPEIPNLKKRKVPRTINPRNARYNICVGRYLRVIEHGNAPGSIYHSIDQIFGHPTVAKNLNALQVADLIVDAFNSVPNAVAVGLDASRFDQHCSIKALQFEHTIYNGVFRSRELARLLSWQLRNFGKSYLADGKVKYCVSGCRMSGDMNTSCGNVIIMCALIHHYMKGLGIEYRLVNNGDDSVLIVSRGDYHKLDHLYEWFLEFGYEMKVESVTDVLEKVVFCQAQPVFDGVRWRMVRQLNSLLKDAVTDQQVSNRASFDAQRGAVRDCGLALTDGLPVLPDYYKLLGSGSDRSAANLMNTGMQQLARGMTYEGRSISDAARLSFARAFDISPMEQELMEQYMRAHELRYSAEALFFQVPGRYI
jgi:hypothetical protein